MIPGAHEDNKSGEISKTGQQISTVSEYGTIVHEDQRLKSRIQACTAEIQSVLQAWQHLDVSALVADLFIALETTLRQRVRGMDGWSQRLHGFFSEKEDDTEVMNRITRGLQGAQNHTRTFIMGLRQLAPTHDDVIASYINWLAATRINSPPSGAASRPEVLRLLSNGMEYLAAQQQFAATFNLQLDHAEQMTADIGHVIHMAQTLVANHASAQTLLATGFTGEQEIVRRYARSRRP